MPTSDLHSLFCTAAVSHRLWHQLLILISIPVQLGVSDSKANLDIELKIEEGTEKIMMRG